MKHRSKMVRFLLSILTVAVVLASCKQDPSAAEVSEDSSSMTSSESKTVVSSPPASQVKGFDFLTACDSFVVSKLVLSGPDGEGDYAYLQGECVTNKTFEVLLVPRSGATPAAEFGDPAQVLAKAAKNNYADYICYAFEMPKQLKQDATGALQIANLYPINAVVKRLDNNTWIRLGQDRADDLAAYNNLRWKILHDVMPQYN